MSILHEMDGGEIALSIDIDQGARISSLNFRGIECVVPFRGEVLTWGWYAMGPWAGRIRDGLVRDAKGNSYQLPTNFTPPHAIHGFTLTGSWQEIDAGDTVGAIVVEGLARYGFADLKGKNLFGVLKRAARDIVTATGGTMLS